MTATSGLVFTYNPEPGEPSMPLMIRGSVIDSVQAETCVVVAEAAPPEAADPTTPGAT
jgi:hypothetical protein